MLSALAPSMVVDKRLYISYLAKSPRKIEMSLTDDCMEDEGNHVGIKKVEDF
jgi:hypothetical protein